MENERKIGRFDCFRLGWCCCCWLSFHCFACDRGKLLVLFAEIDFFSRKKKKQLTRVLEAFLPIKRFSADFKTHDFSLKTSIVYHRKRNSNLETQLNQSTLLKIDFSSQKYNHFVEQGELLSTILAR